MANGIKKDNLPLSSHKYITLDKLYEILELDVLFNILHDKMGIISHEAVVANNWYDLGFDELDGVELIMMIEKEYDCLVDDISANQILEMSPKRLCQILLSNKRDQKIEQIVK